MYFAGNRNGDQQGPQAVLPSGQLVFGAVASEHSTSHFAVAAQVTPHAPLHLMLQLDVSLQSMTPVDASSNLHWALFIHVAVEFAPAFSSHFDEPLQTMELPPPPSPLHAALSRHVTDTAPVLFAPHFELGWQVMAQLPDPHSAEQSLLAQSQVPGEQTQLAPVQVGVDDAKPPSGPALEGEL